MLPDFYLSLHLSPAPFPPLSRCFFNAMRGGRPLPDPGGVRGWEVECVPIFRWVGGWGTHDGKRAKRLVPHRQRQVSGQTLLRAGSSTLQLQHKLFIHEKAVLSLGVYGSGRGCIPSWLHLGPLPSS